MLAAICQKCVEANSDLVREHERIIKKERRHVKMTRPIRLADVIIAVDRFGKFNHPKRVSLQEGQVTKEWKDFAGKALDNVITILTLITSWNKWRDSIDDQSLETIAFLYRLLIQ